MKKYYTLLITSFALVWLWSAYKPIYRDDWLLENVLVFISIIAIALTYKRFKLSTTSYGLITLFLILHVIGSHYTYELVPFGDTLQDWLGASRNMYDRLVHFSYGLLLAYPTWELFTKVGKARGFWAYYIPVEMTLAASAVYEIFEWLAATIIAPEAGVAFLGTQGDVWDAQKDMVLAGLGAVIAMSILWISMCMCKKNSRS